MYSTIEEAWGKTVHETIQEKKINIEPFIINNKNTNNNIEQKCNELEIVNNKHNLKKYNNNKLKNKDIIQSFLVGFLVILILQVINNKYLSIK
jgi:hypothetical protein